MDGWSHPTVFQLPTPLRLPGPAALKAGLHSWIKQEQSTLPSPSTLRAALLASLLLLSPLLALELLRRAAVIRNGQATEREQALEVLHAAQVSMLRTTRDWAHWDDTYAFMLGRNPGYLERHIIQTPIFDDGSVMMFFDPAGRLLHSQGKSGGGTLRDRQLEACAAVNQPKFANPATRAAIFTIVPLLCASDDGRRYLGMISPISDSQTVKPAHGTLVFLTPLLRSDYGSHLRATLGQLQKDFIALPRSAIGQPPTPSSAIEAVTGDRLYTGGGRLVSLRSRGIWLELTRSLAEQSLLLLSLLALMLTFRALMMLDRRRLLLSQRRQELQANRRIRSICKELDALMEQMGLSAAQTSPDARVLARLIHGEGPGTSAELPWGGSPDSTPGFPPGGDPAPFAPVPAGDEHLAERMSRITERFQHFLGSARRLALYDALTQLPNRRYFLETLSLEADRQRLIDGRFAVLFVDIDKFKAINDTYGHAVGDQALVAVAERLRGVMRSGDFLARYGGDEFVMLIPLRDAVSATDQALRQDVYGFANRIAASFDDVMRLETAALEINLSIGVALVNPAEINPQEAMQRSDEAMYRAKLHKTTRIAIFSVDDDVRPRDNYLLYVDLIAATRDRELSIELQPLVDRDGRATAFEALARWRHAQHGEIGPDHFLDLAERYRQMPLLGEALLERSLEAFKIVADREEAGQRPLILNLNLSPSQLCDPALAGMILRGIERHGMEPQRLMLELTEKAMVDHNATVRDNLEQLRRLGMRLSVDDFGTGYSSLQLLQTLRPDQVKIDQSFVQGMTQDPYARRIVGLLAGMAPLMGVEIVAEGVENRLAFEILRDLGINRFQGYLFSPPQAAERFSGLCFPPAGASLLP